MKKARRKDSTRRLMKKHQAVPPSGFHVFKGAEIVNLFQHLQNPDGYKSDWPLMVAKKVVNRRGRKGIESCHLTDAELNAVAWFACLPETTATDEALEALRSKSNGLAHYFFELWMREPDTISKILSGIRESLKVSETRQAIADMQNCPTLPEADSADRKRVQRHRQKTRASRAIQEAVTQLTSREGGHKPLPKRPLK